MSSGEQIEEEFRWSVSHNLNDSSDDEEHITSEELIKHLSILIQDIKSEKFTPVAKQDMYDALEEYITGEQKALDPEAVQYLFRGWWMTDTIRRLNDTNQNPLQPSLSLPNCPYCLREMPKTDSPIGFPGTGSNDDSHKEKNTDK